MHVTTHTVGLQEAMNKLTKISGAVKDLSPAFDEMGPTIIQEFKANFPAAGSNLEAPWKPRIRSYPWPILIKTGTMQKSWEKETKKDQLRIENPTKYATYHHFGSTYLPVRKLVNNTKKISGIVTDRIMKYLKSFF